MHIYVETLIRKAKAGRPTTIIVSSRSWPASRGYTASPWCCCFFSIFRKKRQTVFSPARFIWTCISEISDFRASMNLISVSSVLVRSSLLAIWSLFVRSVFSFCIWLVFSKIDKQTGAYLCLNKTRNLKKGPGSTTSAQCMRSGPALNEVCKSCLGSPS